MLEGLFGRIVHLHVKAQMRAMDRPTTERRELCGSGFRVVMVLWSRRMMLEGRFGRIVHFHVENTDAGNGQTNHRTSRVLWLVLGKSTIDCFPIMSFSSNPINALSFSIRPADH